jgi:1,4-alpha-glucan branching enzyme
MWGDYNQKFAQVKNLYLYMYAHPGKKLNFMGNELAHFREWDENRELDWFLLEYTKHAAFNRFVRDLNHIYKFHPCLSRYDFTPSGFHWIDADNLAQSLYSFYREDEKSVFIVLLNMTPQSYEEYRVGVPYVGTYLEVINSEKAIYDGCDMCNFAPIDSSDIAAHGYRQSINLRIAPFSAMYLQLVK